jgi:hypothetical protein
MPKVLNKYHLGWSHPENSVYVGRPSKWGNPFYIGNGYTRTDVMVRYELWLRQHPEFIEDVKKELKGKDLICWCAPLPCHADLLLELANAEESNHES